MVYPDFYYKFACKSKDCRHSCCKGWEIDVDEDTYSFYCTKPGDMGLELASSVYRDEDGAHFRLTEDESCPFLRKDGLCRIILSMGEEALCDICALHPRFYLDYDKLELAGLGLSCERVCELLWESDKRLRFFDEEGEEFSFLEPGFLYEPRIHEEYIREIVHLFQNTEPIDEEWSRMMAAMEKDIEALHACAKDKLGSFDAARYNRLYTYLMYRQLDRADIAIVAAYAGMAADFIFIMDAVTGDTLECIRRFSEQIEYSTENVDILFEYVAMGG